MPYWWSLYTPPTYPSTNDRAHLPTLNLNSSKTAHRVYPSKSVQIKAIPIAM